MSNVLNPPITPAGFAVEHNGENVLFEFKTKPYEHQLRCLQQFANRYYYALLAEMGTGKTWIAINNFTYLFYTGRVNKMLVIAPNGVQWNWTKRELPEHLIEYNDKLQMEVKWAGYSGGMGAKDDKLFKAFMDAPLFEYGWTNGKILCMNWESLSTAKGQSIAEAFLATGKEKNMIVLDESDYCKNPDAKRTKFIMKLGELAKYKRIMTGTPITNSPFDAYSQFNFLSSKVLGISSFYAFKTRYGVFLPPSSPLVQAIKARTRARNVLIPLQVKGRPVYKNLDDLKRKIEPVSFRVTKAECLDLPPKVYINEYVDLTKKQKQIYKQVRDEGVLQLQNAEVPILNKISILTKLCQITGNNFKLPDGTDYVIDTEHNPKLERLLELIKQITDNDQKVIVWCRYRAEISQIAAALAKQGYTVGTYYGDTKESERKALIDEFQNGSIQVFISNPQSGGTGITLTAASTVIYYSNSFSLHDRLQSEDRAHRIGQDANKVTYINILARHTTDELIQRALDGKYDIAKYITSFNGLDFSRIV